MSPVMVRDGVRRDGFLATLGSRTWRSRASAAAALADLDAVSSRGAYAAWLHRTARAWALLPELPAVGGPAWPLVTVGPQCLAGRDDLAADLREIGARTVPAVRDAAPVDEAFVVGAAFVAVVSAADASVLAEAALALAEREQGAVGVRFLLGCRELAAARAAMRRELAAWAADHEPETAERAVLAARTLSAELAEALQR